MEEYRKQKVLELASNQILFISLNAKLAPPARLRQIEFVLETYGDVILKDYITELKQKFPTAVDKIDER